MITMTQHTEQDPSAGLRELDHRRNDGIDVSLLWDPTTNAVLLSVIDERGGPSFRFRPPAACALDAFRHPFAYATLPPATLERLSV
jgi:hypothetical protein